MLTGNLGDKLIPQNEILRDVSDLKALANLHESMEWLACRLKTFFATLPHASSKLCKCEVNNRLSCELPWISVFLPNKVKPAHHNDSRYLWRCYFFWWNKTKLAQWYFWHKQRHMQWNFHLHLVRWRQRRHLLLLFLQNSVFFFNTWVLLVERLHLTKSKMIFSVSFLSTVCFFVFFHLFYLKLIKRLSLLQTFLEKPEYMRCN